MSENVVIECYGRDVQSKFYSQIDIANYYGISRVLDISLDGVPERSLMRNGEKMYSEFEWRTLMDKTVRI